MDVKLTPLPNAPNADKVDSFAFSINCLGRLPVTGYLSIPKDAAPKSSPILADYLSMVTTDASPNVPAQAALQYHAIAIYVSWHGFETGHEPAWYATQRSLFYKNGGLDTIATNTDWVFHDMYLRVLRALDYMKSRPEWNGKDLIIRGGSLGGIQAIVAAALAVLKAGEDLAFVSSASYDRAELEASVAAGAEQGLSRDEVAEFTGRAISMLAAQILDEVKISGLFLSGGDTAIHFIRQVGATGAEITFELTVGIPLMRLSGGRFDGLKVITKAGAFGTPQVLPMIMRKLGEA